MTKRYIGTKIITAWESEKDGAPGFAVKYADGYTSWSPREAFLEAYRECDALTFGLALEALKRGLKVARAGWNGKGMFVYLVPANTYPAQTEAAKSYFGPNFLVPYNAYLALKGTDDAVSTWAPSVGDVLAEDWVIVP